MSTPAVPLPELYFATVRAAGAEIDPAIRVLEVTLGRAGYETETIRLSELFKNVRAIRPYLNDEPTLSEYEIRNGLMDAGDALRTLFDTAAVAKLGLDAIAKRRKKVQDKALRAGRRGIAFIIRSLMHESEVSFLRAILGPRLFVISMFSREDVRRTNLIRDLGAKPGAYDLTDKVLTAHANDLMRRDQGQEFTYPHPLAAETKDIKRLSLEKTFFEADVFVDLDKREAASQQIERFIALIFGDPYATTTLDEAAMAHAFTALRESSTVARRVGAAVVVDGVLVTVGRNDIPQAGGGQLRQPTEGGNRDELSAEPKASNEEREDVLQDVLRRLFISSDWVRLLKEKCGADLSVLTTQQVEEVVTESTELEAAQDSRVFDLIEFNPTVHAEMSAITAAARKGIPLQDAELYTTTFPCHECTRHIISTGVRRVVYLEPYPKSRAEALFSGEIHLGERSASESGRDAGHKKKVSYEPFMGVAPRRQADLFSWVRRGKSVDEIREWSLSAKRELRRSIEPIVPEVLELARKKSRQQEITLAVREFWRSVEEAEASRTG